MIDPQSGIPESAEVHPSARRLLRRLPRDVRALLVDLLDVMEHSAEERSITVTRTEVVAHHDPEEGTEKLEVRQWVDLPRKRALEHWSEMGRRIEDWIDRQHEPSAELLMEWVAFTVYSDLDDAAA